MILLMNVAVGDYYHYGMTQRDHFILISSTTTIPRQSISLEACGNMRAILRSNINDY